MERLSERLKSLEKDFNQVQAHFKSQLSLWIFRKFMLVCEQLETSIVTETSEKMLFVRYLKQTRSAT